MRPGTTSSGRGRRSLSTRFRLSGFNLFTFCLQRLPISRTFDLSISVVTPLLLAQGWTKWREKSHSAFYDSHFIQQRLDEMEKVCTNFLDLDSFSCGRIHGGDGQDKGQDYFTRYRYCRHLTLWQCRSRRPGTFGEWCFGCARA